MQSKKFRFESVYCEVITPLMTPDDLVDGSLVKSPSQGNGEFRYPPSRKPCHGEIPLTGADIKKAPSREPLVLGILEDQLSQLLLCQSHPSRWQS